VENDWEMELSLQNPDYTAEWKRVSLSVTMSRGYPKCGYT